MLNPLRFTYTKFSAIRFSFSPGYHTKHTRVARYFLFAVPTVEHLPSRVCSGAGPNPCQAHGHSPRQHHSLTRKIMPYVSYRRLRVNSTSTPVPLIVTNTLPGRTLSLKLELQNKSSTTTHKKLHHSVALFVVQPGTSNRAGFAAVLLPGPCRAHGSTREGMVDRHSPRRHHNFAINDYVVAANACQP